MTTSEWLPPVALTVLIVLGDRFATIRKRAYHGMPFPVLPENEEPGTKRRASVRRASGFAYLFGALMVPLVTLTALTYSGEGHPAVDAVRLGSIGTVVVAFYLIGPAARFVVTPDEFRVETAFRRTAVPRRLLSNFSSADVSVRMELSDGRHIDFRVDSLLWEMRPPPNRDNRRTQILTVERIVGMLAAVPARSAQHDDVAVVWRPWLISLAVAAVIGPAIAALVVDLSSGSG